MKQEAWLWSDRRVYPCRMKRSGQNINRTKTVVVPLCVCNMGHLLNRSNLAGSHFGTFTRHRLLAASMTTPGKTEGICVEDKLRRGQECHQATTEEGTRRNRCSCQESIGRSLQGLESVPA
eukprot:934160-Amphidinium_carterae.5